MHAYMWEPDKPVVKMKDTLLENMFTEGFHYNSPKNKKLELTPAIFKEIEKYDISIEVYRLGRHCCEIIYHIFDKETRLEVATYAYIGGWFKLIYTDNTKKALKLCFEAHKNQTDKSGMPYVFHPFHLAEQMQTEETTIVALLHDVVEDTDYTLEDLSAMGFSKAVTDAIALMTHDDDTEYMDYVRAIKDNPIAKAVKLADLNHNSDLSRLDVVDEKALKRREKYLKAIELLEN